MDMNIYVIFVSYRVKEVVIISKNSHPDVIH